MAENDNSELLRIKDIIVKNFTSEHWLDLGALTGELRRIQSHDRLLRSLRFGDSDYSGHAFEMLLDLVAAKPRNFETIKRYLEEKFLDATPEIFVSSKPAQKRITFSPTVFNLPEDTALNETLVSVMMPFAAEYNSVYGAIETACYNAALVCQRADELWEDSLVIQDIFKLILTSKIVVCDFSGRNPNVMYETGIAHTLGKIVIPIAQHKSDIPFDVQHHRFLTYHNNKEGLAALTATLTKRFHTILMPSA